MTDPNDKGVSAANANPPKSTPNHPAESVRRAAFVRERLPDWLDYAERHGLELIGTGKWRTLLCLFHDDRNPSMRVNVASGGWVCMACGASGGDTLAYHMALHGLDFWPAARELGAVVEGAGPRSTSRPAKLPASDALELLNADGTLVWVAACNLAQGVTLTDVDRAALSAAARRIMLVCGAAR